MAETGIERVIALVSDDAEVRASAKALALSALEQAQFLLLHGNDVIRMRIISSMLPAFQKSLSDDKDKSGGKDELKKEFQELREAVMGDNDPEPLDDNDNPDNSEVDGGE